MALPPCGLYRTTREVAGVPSGRLVYFHNHGDPGPGVYLPDAWHLNRAKFGQHGHTLEAGDEDALSPLPAEGLYRVTESFTCCEKKCRTFADDLLVQLGYDGTARPLLFVPEWTDEGLAIPTLGHALAPEQLGHISPLKLARGTGAQAQRH